ncbi:GNAT family N-acetyltransferase [Halovenus sp. HT40]|uniref:GNAT family N-acetyltransferase n=1 Tax=Halovenus sp. HT40 TaxID=3126691 RepID=UPI00300F1B44
METLTVREAVPSDTPEILSVAEAGWEETYGDILAEETISTALDEWYDEAETREAIEHDAVGYFVAERDGSVVGYLSGSVRDDSIGHLGAIYVAPDQWGEGIGTALLQQFEQWCADRDCPEIRLHVLSDNAIGQSFYRSHGYESVESEQTELFGEEVSQQLFHGTVE